MKTRSFAAALIAALLINIAAFAAPDTHGNTARKAEVTRLVTLLPASDAVAVFEAKRFLNDALPKVLTANQPMLAEIMAKITEMETRTGIDLRKFDQVVVGIGYKQISEKETDFEPVAIANGDIGAGALIAVAKLASNGAYREEKVGDRTVFVFTAKDVIQKTTVKTSNSKIADTIDTALKGISREIAVTAIDKNTLAIGTLPRVRETLLGQTHVSTDITSLLSQKDTSVMTFGMKTPNGMAKLLPLENDELGANIDSIQYVSGSMDVSTLGAGVQLAARTRKPDQAQGLKDTLDGLQILGKAIFGSSKRPDQQVYGHMIKNAKFDVHGNDVTLDLLIPQADIDTLIAGIK